MGRRAFAEGVSARRQGMAFLLCGDWHTAEDLVQATLVKVFVSWRKIRRQETAHAYATRTLVNTGRQAPITVAQMPNLDTAYNTVAW